MSEVSSSENGADLETSSSPTCCCSPTSEHRRDGRRDFPPKGLENLARGELNSGCCGRNRRPGIAASIVAICMRTQKRRTDESESACFFRGF